MAERQWIVGWRRIDFNDPEEDQKTQGKWRFVLDCTDTKIESQNLETGKVFQEPEIDFLVSLWFPTLILKEDSNRFFLGLAAFSEPFDDGYATLRSALNEVITAAYEAGRRNIIPPDT